MFVYTIQNKQNGRKYVGKTTKSLQRRWKQHINNAKHGSRTYFHNAIRKYGPENFEFIGWIEVGESQKHIPDVLNKLEVGLIAQTNVTDRRIGYNRTFGGEGVTPTEEIKRKIGKANSSPQKSQYKGRVILWYTSGKTIKWIGQKVGVCASSVLRWLKQWGITIRPSNISPIKTKYKKQIISWRRDRKSTSWIAKRVGVSSNAIWLWLKEWRFKSSLRVTPLEKEAYKAHIIFWYSNQRSTRWIAKQAGISSGAVRCWLKEWGVKVRSNSECKMLPKKYKHKMRIITWYRKGRSSVWIAKKIGITGGTINIWLREWGVKVRSAGEALISPKKQRFKTQILTWYRGSKSSWWIAKRVEVTSNTITRWLKDWDVVVRSVSEARTLRDKRLRNERRRAA